MIKLLRRLNQRRKFNRVGITPREKITSLIKKLHPYQIDKNLIRLGPNADGGYLIPDDLENIQGCFSAGVSTVTGFEEDCLKLGMNVYMADRSVNAPILKGDPDKYTFLKKHIGCTVNDEYITMDAWANSLSLNEHEDLLLQMDIEGAEYMALMNISDSLLSRFRIIVIEFHSLQFLWTPYFFDSANAVFNKLLQTHTCVHIHPNNSCGNDYKLGIEIPRNAEFTFLRNDRLKFGNAPLQFPHKLDYDNTSGRQTVLPKIWYTDL